MAKGKKTGGRSTGTPNRANADLKTVLAQLGTDAKGNDLHASRLHQLTLSDDEHVAMKALNTVLAYRHGKPAEKHEHMGEGGGPIVTKVVFEDASA